MTFPDVLADLSVLALLVGASFLDLRGRRIPNLLTIPAAGLGLVLNALVHGPSGLIVGVQGWLVAIGVLLVPFVMRWLGAGDVKLVAALGAFKGTGFVLETLIYAAVIGGAFALIVLVRQRRLVATGRYLVLFWNKPAPAIGGTPAGSIPYAPVIAFGAAIAWALAMGVGG